jgi:L-alanine-DL-glutamate epimerase-like enolase superfamily enzyme
VAWRGELLDPPERFVDGTIAVPEAPGFGVTLDEAVVRRRLM